MKSAQSQLERHQNNIFIVNFEQILLQFWRIDGMGATYVNSSDQNSTVNICKYYVLFIKMLQGGDNQ